MATSIPRRTVDYLLIGGGLATATAAEEIRKRDGEGSIALISNESHYPYHRPPLSKEYLRGEIGPDGTYGDGGVYVQLADWYKDQRIEVQLSTDALALDPERISEGKHVVAVGSGFIGMEVAASALTRGASVTIVEPQTRIWPHTVTQQLSDHFQQQFTKRGATLRYGYGTTEFVAGPDGKLASVRISNVNDKNKTEDIACDIVVVGVGIELNTEFAATGGLEIDKRHGIVVNEHLETKVADVFAAGDVAAYPDPVVGRMHFEHWDNAIASAQIAAANMVGGDEPYRHVPYFFSDQFDLSINMLGYPSAEAQVVIRGDMNNNAFTAFYVQDGIFRAALMVNDDAQMDLIMDLIAANAPVSDSQKLSDPSFDLSTLRPD
jgi:3-phenylpropionate/trans-cinnamate dioxygenase ferredoxin reductase component